MPSQLSEFTISSCSEGKNAGCSFFITFNWCICLFLTLVSDGRLQWPRLRNSWPFLLKSDVNLFNHLVRKADVMGCCSAGSVLRWQGGCPVFSVADLHCSVVFIKLMQINSIRYLRHTIIWRLDGPPRTLWYVDDNHYHFTGPFREKRVPKNIVVSSEL